MVFASIFSAMMHPLWCDACFFANNFVGKKNLTIYLCFFQDDPRLHGYNVPERVQSFIKAAHDEVRINLQTKVIAVLVLFLGIWFCNKSYYHDYG